MLTERQIARRRGVITAAFVVLACTLTGCVTSEASRYQVTLSRSVHPSQVADADVALAFGLSDVSHASVNLAAVSDKRR